MFRAVGREWEGWRKRNPDAHAEEFIGDMATDPLWRAVVHYIAARLAEPDQVRLDNELRYGEKLTKPSPSAAHHRFAAKVLGEYDLVGAVTTNYDLLAERTLRHRRMVRPQTPGFYYAGLSSEPVQGSSTFSVEHKWVKISGTVPLCKLHGSLNWTATTQGIRAYADCRPAFRSEATSYIVAPTPEKQRPDRLKPVWDVAERVLSSAEEWIVVGYSAPLYDQAVAALLATAAGKAGGVRVIDPDRRVADRFRSITPRSVTWEGGLDDFVGPF